MSQISLKSISGITSITTPAGVDNQFTLHTNNTSQAFKLDLAGNIHINNHINITGVCTATTFSGSGASLTNLNGSNIASGTVPVARIGTGTKNTSTFYRGDGTFATVTPPAITAINSASNNRIVTSDGGTTVTAESGTTFDGTSLGINADNDIRFTTGAWTGNAYGKIQLHNQSLYISGGSTALYSIIFRVNNQDKIYMKDDGTFYPTTNNVSDLGTSSNRWRHVYTGDLHLSNEGIAANDGKGNSVDNTWGDWTIQEGQNDLFLLNNRNGKKYKFNLTEVS